MAAKRGGPRGSEEQELSVSTVRLRKDQWEALRTEAFKRAQAKGTARPDASEVIREAVDEWLRKRK